MKFANLGYGMMTFEVRCELLVMFVRTFGVWLLIKTE